MSAEIAEYIFKGGGLGLAFVICWGVYKIMNRMIDLAHLYAPILLKLSVNVGEFTATLRVVDEKLGHVLARTSDTARAAEGARVAAVSAAASADDTREAVTTGRHGTVTGAEVAEDTDEGMPLPPPRARR